MKFLGAFAIILVLWNAAVVDSAIPGAGVAAAVVAESASAPIKVSLKLSSL